MQSLGFIIWAVVIMAILNILVVGLTLGTKALRVISKHHAKRRTERLEEALDSSLETEEIHPDLKNLGSRDLDILSALLIQYLSVLRGSEREWLVGLATEAGLREVYSQRISARGRWRKARAAENLGYFGGPPAVVLLTRLLSNPDETLRAVAARALARIGNLEAVEALARTLNDPSELTRLRMAENLERIGAPAIPHLVEVLEGAREEASTDGPVQAARVLGGLRALEARSALIHAALHGESVDLRAKSALSLGKIGDPEDISVLLKAAEDEAWPVRTQAASSLGMIGEVSTIPVLQRLTVDQEWWVRLNASRSLSNIGPAGERALAEILQSEDRFARDRAAATLEERGITLRAVKELTLDGERGASARAMIQGMVRAGAVRYLTRLTRTLPDKGLRDVLRRTMAEAHDA